MTWGNPPKFVNVDKPPAKKITPEDLAKSGSEDGNQAALFCWAAANIVQYPQLKYLFAIPNGGSRHIAEATKMVATGLRKGVPDIFLPSEGFTLTQNNRYFGCFIEMKTEKRRKHKNGGLEDDQIEWIEALQKAGYCCKVCYNWIEARDTLIAYLEGKL